MWDEGTRCCRRSHAILVRSTRVFPVPALASTITALSAVRIASACTAFGTARAGSDEERVRGPARGRAGGGVIRPLPVQPTARPAHPSSSSAMPAMPAMPRGGHRHPPIATDVANV